MVKLGNLMHQHLTSTIFSCVFLTLGAIAASVVAADEPAAPSAANVCLRGSIDNARIAFEKMRRGRVAFMGGSITEMNGYRPMVCAYLQKRFPDTEFTFIDAGVSSTCSTTGAFRLENDVLSKGPINLFFVEFAVNDDQDARHSRRECIRGMEGIVRHTRMNSPATDLVFVHFINPEMLATLQSGKTPLTIGCHEKVARHYGVPSLNLAKEVAEQITSGKLTWEKFGGTHPAPFGNAIAAKMVEQLLETAWSKPLPADAKPQPHQLPVQPVDAGNYGKGRFLNPSAAAIKNGWTLGVPDWKALPGSKRSRFTDIPMLAADRPGAELTLKFAGTAVGAYVVAGPDAGALDVIVDGEKLPPVDLCHAFSEGLHYPRTVMFAADLSPGEHTLALRVSEKTSSKGHAARIMQFAVNGSANPE